MTMVPVLSSLGMKSEHFYCIVNVFTSWLEWRDSWLMWLKSDMHTIQGAHSHTKRSVCSVWSWWFRELRYITTYSYIFNVRFLGKYTLATLFMHIWDYSADVMDMALELIQTLKDEARIILWYYTRNIDARDSIIAPYLFVDLVMCGHQKKYIKPACDLCEWCC